MRGLFLQQLTLFTCSVIIVSDACIDVSEYVTNFHYLKDSGYRKVILHKNMSSFEGFLKCTSECLKSTNCQSLNYENATRLCILNTAGIDKDRLVPSSLSMVLDRSSWPFPLVPPCGNIACPANEKCAEYRDLSGTVGTCIADETPCEDHPSVHRSNGVSSEGNFSGAKAFFACNTTNIYREVTICTNSSWAEVTDNCQHQYFVHSKRKRVAFETCACKLNETCFIHTKTTSSSCINNNYCGDLPPSMDGANYTFVIVHKEGVETRAFFVCPADYILCASSTCASGHWSSPSKWCGRNVWYHFSREQYFAAPCPVVEGWRVSVVGMPLNSSGSFSINLEEDTHTLLHMRVYMDTQVVVFNTKFNDEWQTQTDLTDPTFPFQLGEKFQIVITNMGMYYDVLLNGTTLYLHNNTAPGHTGNGVSTYGDLEVDRLEILPKDDDLTTT